MPIAQETTHPLAGRVQWQFERAESRAPVAFLDTYVEQHLQPVHVPQLVGRAAPDGGVLDGTVRFHRAAAAQLLAAWREVAAEGLLDRVVTFGGAFMPRLVTTLDGAPTNQLSAHALGLAFDLNPEHYPLGAREALHFGQPGGLREMAPLFARHGFQWGGWEQPANGSHFEVQYLLAEGTVLPTRALVLLDGQPQCHLLATRIGDEHWVEAELLAKQLGGEARVLPPRADGPPSELVEVAVTARGGTTVLAGRCKNRLGLVRLPELLALFELPHEILPGRERVDITTR